MKKFVSLLLILFIPLSGCMAESNVSQVQAKANGSIVSEGSLEIVEKIVADVVEKFGHSLQQVSLLGPHEELEKSMNDYYSELVSSNLIEQWLKDPTNAPGRLTSSPWPDRIEIKSIEKLSENAYEVTGEIIEITSADDIANTIPIQLTVEKIGESWLIANVDLSK